MEHVPRGWTLSREEMVTSGQRSQGLRWPEGEGEVVNSVKGLRESQKKNTNPSQLT